jgi:uncharacterized protein with HEPN domain
MNRDEATLLDIAGAAHLILEFKRGMNKAEFLQDIKTQSSVLHQLMVVGEAVKPLSNEYCVNHPEIPWALIAGMRDKLIHGYDIVDLDEVWKTANTDVPDVLSLLQPLLPQKKPS